jgi:hypothetical protein
MPKDLSGEYKATTYFALVVSRVSIFHSGFQLLNVIILQETIDILEANAEAPYL